MDNSPYSSIHSDATSPEIWAKFQELLDQARVPPHQRPYHSSWVRRWIDGLEGMDLPRNAPQRYSEKLLDDGVAEWQARQAERSVECWLDARRQVHETTTPSPSQPAPTTWEELLLQLDRSLKVQQYSPRTRQTYAHWIKLLARSHPKLPTNGEEASLVANAFLRELALARNLAPNSIAIARNAMAWVFVRMLGFEIEFDQKGSAHRGRRLPRVISAATVRNLLEGCDRPWDLFFGLQYGCGLRLMELLELRVLDLDLERDILTVKHGKGDHDRQLIIPKVLRQQVAEHLDRRKMLWESDLANGFAFTDMPNPKGGPARTVHDWEWQHVFPSTRPMRHPSTGELRRWRPLETLVRDALREAATKVGITGRVHPHLLRHCYATHLLEAGIPIQQIQEQLGHARLQTTMIYLHVKSPVAYAKSPLDFLVP